jgi:hypothetical protein
VQIEREQQHAKFIGTICGRYPTVGFGLGRNSYNCVEQFWILQMYQLFYHDLKIGQVVLEDLVFPAANGYFEPMISEDSSSLRSLIQSYIKASIQAGLLGDKDDYGENWAECQAKIDDQYAALIDSEEWFLVDATGAKIAITIPVFHAENRISWG